MSNKDRWWTSRGTPWWTCTNPSRSQIQTLGQRLGANKTDKKINRSTDISIKPVYCPTELSLRIQRFRAGKLFLEKVWQLILRNMATAATRFADPLVSSALEIPKQKPAQAPVLSNFLQKLKQRDKELTPKYSFVHSDISSEFLKFGRKNFWIEKF
jgi:hypothetical protein